MHGAVRNVWAKQQNDLFDKIRGQGLLVGGDGRSDSMGHSAKYGSYTTVDLKRNKILHVDLVQSNEVKSSAHMELKGLQNTVKFFKDSGLKLSALITDRHRQIQKWVRENMVGVLHYFDCWHIAKSIKKMLCSVMKKKSCNIIGSWLKSIINHYYWSVTSTEIGSEDLIEAKWTSLTRHIQNIHHGHKAPYPKCSHLPLEKSVESSTKWIKPDTEAADKLQAIIEKKTLVKDIRKSSPLAQTSVVEGYHSLLNHFAPKMYHFHFHGMESRLRLAALHFNENSKRQQYQNQQGESQYTITFPKYTKGGYIVRKFMEDCTYGYMDCLFEELIGVVNLKQEPVVLSPAPPNLCSSLLDLTRQLL